MAALGSQSIASSYEQILQVDRDGGGDTTTHVSVKDGDNGTTFGFTIATDALMMSSTNRLEFGDTGTYIHQSADGVLDLVSDTEIEINATTIDMNGAVDISGNTQLSGTVTVGVDGTGKDVKFFGATATNGYMLWDESTDDLILGSSSKLGIGTASPSGRLDLGSPTSSQDNLKVNLGRWGGHGTAIVDMLYNAYWNGSAWINDDDAKQSYIFRMEDGVGFTFQRSPAQATPSFTTDMTIDENGNVLIGKTAADATAEGFGIISSGQCAIVNDGSEPLILNRLSNDGTIVSIRQASSEEGTISVSGSTVSYNAFLGSHFSELSDGSTPDIEKGTVISTIDEMKEGYGDRLPKVKVSDSEGDKRVYGVFGWWNYADIDYEADEEYEDEDGETQTRKVTKSKKADSPTDATINALGAGLIRVTGACEGGDLLESKGDGTASVQDDDIIRSKTIAKVTVGNSGSGVNLVPCVLCCG